jgi:hypothetical protein
MQIKAWLVAGVAVVLAACAQAPRSVGESTLSGTAALASYPTSARSVVATDELGRATSATLAADGSFSLRLKRAHTYRVAIVTDGQIVPVVYPRLSGKTTTTFALKSDGAQLSLGRVRYIPAVARVSRTPATPSALHVLSATEDTGESSNDNQDDGNVSCEDGSQGSGNNSDDMETGDNVDTSGGDVAEGDHNIPETVDGCSADDNNNTEDSTTAD